DDVEDRLVPVVDPLDDEDRLLPNAIIRADGIDERSFLMDVVDETALEHVLGFGGHREAVLASNHVDGVAEARLGERGGDATLVDAILDGCPAGEEIPWVEADAHGDLEFPAGLRRLVLHVTQVTGDDAARAPIRAQDEDAMEREVPRALPLGDPGAGRGAPARVLREELRDRQFPEVDVRRLMAHEVRTGHDARILRMRLRVHQLREEIRIRDSKGGRDALSGGPEISDRLAPL